MRPGRQRWRYHILLLPLLSCLLHVAQAVKCYCTDDHCVPYGSCDGTVCLVGILRDSNQVIRTCGTNTLGCHKNEDDKWTDLCACDQPFCNTFAFLRSHTRRTSSSSSSSASSSSSSGFASPSSSSSFDSSRQEDPMSPAEPPNHHDAPLVFNRMDRPDDGIPRPPPGLMERETNNKTSLLTLLLVVVPLTVGAATVMVVAFNYYCHLC